MASQAPDPKAYYGYLFKPDKTPTDTLDALLRAVAQYIVRVSSSREKAEIGKEWTASRLTMFSLVDNRDR